MKRTKHFAALFAAAILFTGSPLFAADEPVVAEPVVVEESQWEKFKEGAKTAGEAVVQGAKNTGEKVADGTKKTGHAIAETYEDAKDYVKEKME